MQNQEQFVTLREELDAIDEYLDIEVIRFGSRLSVKKSIAPDTLDRRSCRACCCSRWSRTASSTASRARSAPAPSRSAAAARATSRSSRSKTMASAFPMSALPHALSSGIGLSNVNETPARALRRRRAASRWSARPAGRDRARRDPASRCAARRRESPHDRSGALTAVVADDEQLARDELCFLLGQLEGVEVVGQAANGVEALDEIARHTPDVAFLDVQMPGLTGFEVARRLMEAGTGPSVIFVTAFDQRAIEALRSERRGLRAEAGGFGAARDRGVAGAQAPGRKRAAGRDSSTGWSG